jgi:DNA-binding transcriptional LysR family regulator
MELKRLRYFIAVAEAGHFRRAAEGLRVAQPALSRQIRALEAELGVSLFDRLPRGVRLSDAGRVFLPDAKRALAEVEDAVSRVKCFANGRSGRLRVAMSSALTAHRLIIEAIRTFRIAQPDVELTLQTMESADQSDAVLEGALDAGFAYRWPDRSSSIMRYEIDSLKLMAAICETHPLAAEDELDLAKLEDEPLICVARSISTRPYDKLIRAFRARNLTPRLVQEANSTVILDLVSAGMGIGVISAALETRLPTGVVFRPIAGLASSTPFDFLWRSDNHSPDLGRLVETIMALSPATVRH